MRKKLTNPLFIVLAVAALVLVGVLNSLHSIVSVDAKVSGSTNETSIRIK